MPELPDLEVFSQHLNKKLAGKRLSALQIESKRVLPAARKSLLKALVQQKIKKIYRDGKELRFSFANERLLGMHLMLRGQLQWLSPGDPVKYAICILQFDKGPALALTDPRNMAKISLDPPDSETPDALSPDFTFQYLKGALSRSRASVKSILTDQHVLRGVGNAYADEILWKARIAPQSTGEKVPEKNARILFRAIASVLKNATTQINKKHPDLIGGEIRDFLKIHQPGKETSPTGATIQVFSKSGSKTYFTDEQVLFT